MKAFVCILAVVLAAASCSAAAKAEEYSSDIVWNAAKTGGCDDLYKKTFAAAESGSAPAKAQMGFMTLMGCGTKPSETESFRWLLKAAEQGDAYGMDLLGTYYAEGLGTKQDYKEAFRWFNAASEKGEKNALGRLAALYAEGNGTAKNIPKAIQLYKEAADNGDKGALASWTTLTAQYGEHGENTKEAREFDAAEHEYNCDAISGDWKWFNGGFVEFTGDNNGFWRFAPKTAPAATAKWECRDDETYVVRWSSGFTDTLALSEDENSLTGFNAQGAAISATRMK